MGLTRMRHAHGGLPLAVVNQPVRRDLAPEVRLPPLLDYDAIGTVDQSQGGVGRHVNVYLSS